MSTSAPPPEQGLALYCRLCAGDPVAPRDLCAAYLPYLIAYLERAMPQVDPHLREEAAERALLALVRPPYSYDPARSGLAAYLRMAARGDLLNLLAREKRQQHGQIPLEGVEDCAVAGKYPEREDERPTLPPALLALLDERERKVWELMRAGERRTAMFAEALGLGARPRAEQKREVERAKDRIMARLRRAGGDYEQSA